MHTQYLSWQHVLSVVGKEEWLAIGERDYPVKLLVAGKRSVCIAGNVEGMVDMVPRTRLAHFPEANHSIHNAGDPNIFFEFIQAVEDVYIELEFTDALVGIKAELDGNTTLPS